MFGKRREEMELLKQSFESLEKSQKNTELMVTAVKEIMSKQEQKSVVGIEHSALECSDEEKIKAAYALNLCTVSVSQIIDYADVNILEQEYETILNNLNLEHMPKDEALLNILKQLLDTVTFFRIMEGDKQLIEKEYQHKMKNAIWSAVPNFGLIVAGGDPVTIAIALASQVGIGYMNYRKAKADNNLEKEEKEWQLQRSAIEQLNGLRRELFDTSWRLADRYEFPDEYRLTEKQITQYNKILMDTDDIRKYERLVTVQEYFVAYPPFWYYFGHAANSIAQSARKEGEMDIYEKYQKLAINHFDIYMQSNRYSLLREDQITSSCALEYIDLLDAGNDKKKIKELLGIAEKMSGRECDVLQLCAIAYLRIKETNPAVRLLKYLVNENYNEVTNAQLLSSIYVSGHLLNNQLGYDIEYKMLSKKVNENLLFPFPINGTENIDELKEDFIEKQQDLLLRHYAYVLGKIIKQYGEKFNRCIPVPDERKNYPNSFFSDQKEYREDRINQYKTYLSNENNRRNFASRLLEADFPIAYLDVLNDMLNVLESIIPNSYGDEDNDMLQLTDSIKEKIEARKKKFNELQEKLNSEFPKEDIESFFSLSFRYFTEEFFKRTVKVIEMHVLGMQNMVDFSKEETLLREFCLKQGISEFRISVGINSERNNEYTGNEPYLSSELLGGEAFRMAEIASRARKMAHHIVKMRKSIVLSEKTDFLVRFKEDRLLKFYFKKKRYGKKVMDSKVAVLKNNSFGMGIYDLIFTTDGIVVDKLWAGFTGTSKITFYDSIELNEDGEGLKIGTEIYRNKSVDINELYNLIQDLVQIASEADINSKKSGSERYLQYKGEVKKIDVLEQ
ncbi:MAG: hypothetical protein NC412_12440 [Roseburia sp.]|nr:hypothetical protein [Roseburia sp.]MCM1279523.1 hypothetical protein [Robinsoniella sp.]